MGDYTEQLAVDLLTQLADDSRIVLDADQWLRPRQVEVHQPGESIRWYYGRGSWVLCRSGETLLHEFAAIANRTGEQVTADDTNRVIRFARKWGVLELCAAHQMPRSHNAPHRRDHYSAQNSARYCEPITNGADWAFENIAAWLHFAAAARACILLHRAQTLKPDEREAPEMRQLIAEQILVLSRTHGVYPNDGPIFARVVADIALSQWENWEDFVRQLMGHIVNDWLVMGGVRPHLEAAGRQHQFKFQVNGVFGAVAAQLMLRLLSPKSKAGIEQCSSCRNWFTPDFTARRGIRRYCTECRAKDAGAAERKRRQRELDRMYPDRERQPNRKAEQHGNGA